MITQGVSKKYFIYSTLLHLACKYGNLELVKYLISLNKFDMKSENISINFFSYNIQIEMLIKFSLY